MLNLTLAVQAKTKLDLSLHVQAETAVRLTGASQTGVHAPEFVLTRSFGHGHEGLRGHPDLKSLPACPSLGPLRRSLHRPAKCTYITAATVVPTKATAKALSSLHWLPRPRGKNKLQARRGCHKGM